MVDSKTVEGMARGSIFNAKNLKSTKIDTSSGAGSKGIPMHLDQEITVTIGRGKDNTIQVNDPTVSRKHAEIKFYAASRGSAERAVYESVDVKDLGSSNKTKILGGSTPNEILSKSQKSSLFPEKTVIMGNTTVHLTGDGLRVRSSGQDNNFDLGLTMERGLAPDRELFQTGDTVILNTK